MSAVKELINEVVGGAVGSITGRGQKWDMDKWSTFMGKGGTNFGSGAVSSKRKAEIIEQEERMKGAETGIGQLVIDPVTGLPMDPELKERRDLAVEEKGGEISELGREAKTEAERFVANMYKTGQTTHGKTIGKMRQAGDVFTEKAGDISSTFEETVGGLEDEAQTMLSTIKGEIEATKDLFGRTGSKGSAYRKAFPKKIYETSLGAVKPLEDVMEQMYEYDYLTGKKKK